MAAAAAQTCFRIITANYEDCVAQSEEVEKAIAAFTTKPAAKSLEKAKLAWIKARFVYGQSEAYRFCGGPIDAEGGPEELLNAWPIDEAWIDRVPGGGVVSIIENEPLYPKLTGGLLTELNMKEGEKNITCGWHAVEFLLWGQDTSATGAGQRPITDFTTAAHAARRRDFLTVASSEVTRRLRGLVEAWRPGARDNHRAAVEKKDADDALRSVVLGMVMLSGFELASERIGVPCETRLQEEEHSCFSDTTNEDLRANIRGLANLWHGKYVRVDGSVVQGVSLKDLTVARDAELAQEITNLLDDISAKGAKLSERFDQAILQEPTAPGQQTLRALAKRLEELGQTLKRFAERMGRPYSPAELEG